MDNVAPWPYGCNRMEADADKPVTMPDMTQEEIVFVGGELPRES